MALLFLWFVAPLHAAVLVDLDATSLPVGALPTWSNAGTVTGNFAAGGTTTPSVVSVAAGTGTVNAVALSGNNFYVGPVTPASVTGSNAPRSIEAWVMNPAINAEETIIAWSRRGGGDGTNSSFNYGSSTVFGAVGHWGAPDMGFYSNAAPSPAAGVWHYLCYVFDGSTVTLYVDGVQSNTKAVALNTWAVSNASVALKFIVGSQNEANGTQINTAGYNGSMNYGRLRVRNELLTAAQIANTFAAEAPIFGRSQVTIPTFTATPSVFLPGQVVTLNWTTSLATSASIDQGVGAIALPGGSIVVTPTVATTYTLSAANSSSNATAQVTVTPFAAPQLANRWSFSEGSGTAVNDSVGTAHGIVRGTTFTRTAAQIVLPGGASGTAPYIDLPNGLISSKNEVTLEGWMTINGTQAWSRIIDFGRTTLTGAGGAPGELLAPGTPGSAASNGTEYLMLTAQVGADQGTKQLELNDSGVVNFAAGSDPAVNGQQFHFAVVYSADGGSGTPQVRYYRNGTLILSVNTTNRLQNIQDVNNWLGRSNWSGDANLQGAYNEFRLWNGPLSAGVIADTVTAGPDALPTAPRIDAFTALPVATIFRGASVRLSYVLSDPTGNGLTASIDQGAGALSETSGFVTVSPALTTTYTLTVTNGTATRTSAVTIVVAPSEPRAEHLAIGAAFQTPTPIELIASDPNTPTAQLTYAIVAGPAHGALTGSGASRTYTPANGYAGPDSFTYRANDGTYDSNVATVSITVFPPPTPPTGITLSEDALFTNYGAGSFAGRLQAADVNPDDQFTFALIAGAGDTHNAFFTLSGNQLIAQHDFSGDVGQTISIRLRVTDSAGNVFETVVTRPVQPPDLHVKINEINYNPTRNTLQGEFIELYNPFDTEVNVGGWRFTKGVEFIFPSGATIAPRGYLVIAREPAIVNAMYGITALGPWIGGLGSDGDDITLRDAAGIKVDGVEFGTTAPWPVPPNGDGPSLELVNPDIDNDLGGHWRASVAAPATVNYLTKSSGGWRYRKGTSEASIPIGGWRAEGFVEDGTWLTGLAPIGVFKLNSNVSQATLNGETGVILGTQLADMATYVASNANSGANFTVSYRSVFFRKTFNVAGAIPRAVLLRVMHNDAAIIWINGQEVGRFGFPAGAPTNPAFNTTLIYERGNDPWSEVVLLNAPALLHAGTNTIAIQGFAKTPQTRALQEDFPPYNVFDFCIDAELRNSPDILGTPGSANSAFAANCPPAVRDVNHAPVSPKSFEPVTVITRVSDSQGVGSVQLAYQVCPAGGFIPATLPLSRDQLLADARQPLPANPAFEDPANWTIIPMSDNGSVAGDVPGDGLFTARLPAQPHRTLVRYRVLATDLAGANVRVPTADDPRKNYAFFVYDGVPNYAANGQLFTTSTLTTLPVYQWLTRSTDYTRLLAYSAAEQFPNNIDLNTLNARRVENFEGALVVDSQVIDHARVRLRGGNSRYAGAGKRHFRFNFPKGTPLRATDERGEPYAAPWEEMLFNKMFGNKGFYDFGIPYEAGGKLWTQQGIPMPESHWVHFRVVQGAAEAPSPTTGDFWGLYQALELPEGKNFLDARNLPRGNFYKMSDWTQNGEMNERYQAATAPDFGEDFDNIRYNIHQTASESFLRTFVHTPLWFRYNAVQEAIRHYDIFVEPTGRHRVKNLIWYFEPQTGNPLGKLWFMPYDWDASFGPSFNNGWDFMHNAVHDHADIPDSPTWQLPKQDRTAMRIEHRNAIREFRDLVWFRDGSGRGPFDDMVDDALATIVPFWPADRARWPATGAIADYTAGAPAKVQDMKNFAFTGWTDTIGADGADPAVGAGGRAAFLDSISDGLDVGQLPATPTISYTGAAGYPVDGLTFQSSAFSDPQPGTFAAMQWRVGEITDPTAPAYDVTAERLYEATAVWESGEITPFAAGIAVPASTLRVGHTYRARVRHKDTSGRWGHWSAPSQFTSGSSNYVQVLKDNLMVTEVMYQPAAPTAAEASAGWLQGDFEFIELRNISNALTLDLSNVRFTKGIDFDFVGSAITSLAPGARVLVVKRTGAFNLRYGTGRPVAGEWDAADNLSNSGEEVKVSFGAGAAIQEFIYDDESPWPTQADVGGYSLVLKAPETRPNHNLGVNWRASYVAGGTPGGSDRQSFDEWAAANSVTDALGDDDADGASHLLEYYLGGNPHVFEAGILPTPAVQRLTVGGVPQDFLTLTFRRVLGSDEAVAAVQWSSDLASWAANGALVSSTDLGDGSVTEVWRAPQSMSASSYFGRLRVIKP